MRLSTCSFALAIAVVWQPEAASAQTRQPITLVSYVSLQGDDNATCAISSDPCATLQAAFEKTFANGIVYIIENALGGAVINRPMNIKSFNRADLLIGLTASPVTVSVPAGQTVVFENLTFVRAATGAQLTGVIVTGAGKVTLKNCGFNGLAAPAVDVSGPAGARVLLDNVTIANNGAGVRVKGAGGAANTVFIQQSTIDANGGYAVQVDGAANVAVISSSTLSGSNSGPDLSLVNGGRAISYRNNVIRSGTPTQTLPTN